MGRFVIDTNASTRKKLWTSIIFWGILINESVGHFDSSESDAKMGQYTRRDPHGYVMYCPCMGRFGNQADHFLGALAFARGLNRTLILPPWIEYDTGSRSSRTVPFGKHFNVSRVQAYHKAVTMENFFQTLANSVWPGGKRLAFCYSPRRGPEENSCNAKDGNPFGPFWDAFNVEFDGSITYKPLSYDVHHHDAGRLWNEKYPPDDHPVLALTGAPASFPVQQDNVHLQAYLIYNDEWEAKAKEWIKVNLPRGPFVGVHLRNGPDWERACEHVPHTNQLFSSPQCLGYLGEHGKLTQDICFPSKDSIIAQVKAAVKKVGAESIFVASDNDHMIKELTEAFPGVSINRQSSLEPPIAHLDLAVLIRSNLFIGNCISSFTAFVKRSRDVDGLPSEFFSVYPKQKGSQHKEL